MTSLTSSEIEVWPNYLILRYHYEIKCHPVIATACLDQHGIIIKCLNKYELTSTKITSLNRYYELQQNKNRQCPYAFSSQCIACNILMPTVFLV